MARNMATATRGKKALDAVWEPIDSLELLPGNPRRGDIDAIAASLQTFKQRKPIVCRRADRTVIAGNHTLQAARQLGWTEIAVMWVDDDETTAKAYALADNRTAELGGYDDAMLAALIAEVHEADEELFGATGWDTEDLGGLLAATADPDPSMPRPGAATADPDPSMPRPGDERYTPAWVFEGMGLRFDLDVAAPVDEAQRRVPADRHLTIHDDGLTAPWEGLVWMNPPYSAAARWGRRFAAHPDGVCLIIVSNSPWVPELWEHADCFVPVPFVDFDTPLDQEGAIGMMTFMAAQGSGTPGLERLADLWNWPLFSCRDARPVPHMPMGFGRVA